MTYFSSALAVCLTVGALSAQVGPGRGGGFGGRGGGPQNQQQNQQLGAAQQAAPAPTKPEDLASIQGQVFNAATGEPLKKATVSLRGLSGRGQPTSAVSDAAGQFSFTGVEPGRYRLFAERNGFVRQEYGARAPERPGSAINLDKAQRMTSVSLRLAPQAVILGRILDEDGEPVRGVTVQAMRMGYNGQGRRQLVPAGNVQTNDLGEYRLYDIPGGKYYVSAMLRGGPQTPGKDRFTPAYYPGTSDPTSAVQLDVPAGTQLRGIDLTLRRAPTVSVRGKIVNDAATGPGRGSSVRLVTRGSNLSMTLGQSMPSRGQGGAFEIQGVTPGSYTLVVDTAEQRRRYTYRQPIEVGSGGIDGLNVTIPAPADLTGQVRLDGQGELDFSSLTVTLRFQDPFPGATPNAKVKQDGSFTVEGLMPDNYEVNLTGLPASYFVKSARYASVEALESGLNLSAGGGGKLELSVSPAAAQVEGVVVDAKQEPAKGALVTLVPEASRRSHVTLFKTARTDDSGHYTIQGISPGDYSLYAFEDIESGAYYNPDFLRPLESSGETVSLRENSHEVRRLKQIPATE
jgi:protocatechuate 3,4-dioxygenase beta subunit